MSSEYQAHRLKLESEYPWARQPLICSAPMRLIAGPQLAVAVSQAGGLGFIGAGSDLSNLHSDLSESSKLLQLSPNPPAPKFPFHIGIGFLNWGADINIAVREVSKWKPAAVWFFAPSNISDLVMWTDAIRTASSITKIWVQVGTVASSLEVARSCAPDVLVIQGSDAGGHGLEQSSSIITLLPECTDALRDNHFGDIPLIATGGIIDGRGAAAALSLGASGICMGTRFLATPEAIISTGYRNAVLDAWDGGVSTVRTKVYDRLRGTTGWPEGYNGRGVINATFRDAQGGMTEEENKRLYDDAMKKGDEGWGRVRGRATTYAGTGVGLVNRIMDAGKIVDEVSREMRIQLGRAISRL